MGQLIKTDGFVLRIIPFQDHDLILTLFTTAMGKTSVFVKGARRPSSRYGPEIDLLSHSEFVLLDTKNIKPLREAALKRYFSYLKQDYDRLNCALHGTRLLSQLVREGQQDPLNLALFSAYLEVLDQSDTPLALYELAFKLRVLDNFGVAPQLQRCVRCESVGKLDWFSLERGGVICGSCHNRADQAVSGGVTQSLNALRTMSWTKLKRLRLYEKDIASGNQLLDRFMSYHIQDVPLKTNP